jgi:hypothetical protein
MLILVIFTEGLVSDVVILIIAVLVTVFFLRFLGLSTPFNLVLFGEAC